MHAGRQTNQGNSALAVKRTCVHSTALRSFGVVTRGAAAPKITHEQSEHRLSPLLHRRQTTRVRMNTRVSHTSRTRVPQVSWLRPRAQTTHAVVRHARHQALRETGPSRPCPTAVDTAPPSGALPPAKCMKNRKGAAGRPSNCRLPRAHRASTARCCTGSAPRPGCPRTARQSPPQSTQAVNPQEAQQVGGRNAMCGGRVRACATW